MMNAQFITPIIILIILWFIIGLWISFFKLTILSFIKKHRETQADHMRFLQIKIPKNAVAKSSDIDATDHIQTMKNNIEIMNQIYKNFSAIFEDKRKFRKLWNNYISMEILVEKEIIKFIIWVPEDHIITLEKMISSFYPWAIIESVDQPKLLEAWKFMDWWEFHLTKNSVHPIKTYESFEADPMDSLLSACSKIDKDEKLLLQILVEPLEEKRLKKLRKKAEKIKDWKDNWRFLWFLINIWKGFRNDSGEKSKKDTDKHKHDFSQQQLWDFDKKMDDELFNVKIRTFATSDDPKRPQKIIDDLSRLFNQYNYIWLNTLKFKKTKNIKSFAKEVVLRLFFSDKWRRWNINDESDKTMILNIKELSSIIHFPHSRFNLNPRIARQKYKIVPAPDDLPNEWITVWYNNYGGVKKEIRLTDKDRFRHVYILWQTGTWKTTIMLTQMIEDMQNWRWFTFLDPHWDACNILLSHFPKERIDDLIYFDLSNTEYPIAFNPLDWSVDEDDKDVITNDLVEMFVNMYWEEIFWPRIQDYFRNACFLLMDQPEWWTLVDIMRLFTDDAFAESKIRNIKNPVIAARWNKTYKKMWDREKAEIIPFIQAKFWPFTTGTYIRNIIWQPKSSFIFDKIMQEKKVVIINLSKWIAGEINSQLVGRMVTMQLKLAALRRAKIAENDRVPHYLYIDEFQNYVSQSIESILSEARKYRLWLVVAHQYVDQLKKEWLGWNLDLSKTIFGNIWSMFIFKVWAPDAESLAKEFEPEFSQTDIVNTEAFMWACKISVNNQQSRPFSFKAKIPYESFGGPKPLNSPEKIEIMKQISALKRGTKRELVDKEIYFRVWV